MHLSIRFPNEGGGSEPSQRFDSIPLDTKAFSVHHAEIECRPRIELSQRAPYPKRGIVITALEALTPSSNGSAEATMPLAYKGHLLPDFYSDAIGISGRLITLKSC